MMKLYKKITLLTILAVFALSAWAQDNQRITHQLVFGYNFGATAPVPIPREVRKIRSYWPQFTPQLGYNISYQLQDRWYLQTGVLLDLKGMGVRDEVKYMYTDIWMDQDNIKGYFTGKNETKVKLSYFTIPLRIAYSLTPTWKIRAGGYFSYRSSSEFSGTVWDGYIRETGVTGNNIIDGEKIEIPNKNEATFDFGKEMRNYDVGISVGFEHTFQNFKDSRFGIYGDFTYGLTPVFPSSFKGIDMEMRNIYLTLGATYKL